MNAPEKKWSTLWRGLGRREQALLGLGMGAVFAALLILVGIVPAAKTLYNAPARQRQLDSALLEMQVLQVRAQALQTQPRLGRDEALQVLQASLRLLGNNVQIAVSDQRATVTLMAARPDALAQWLIHARVNARAVPLEARLIRSRAAIEPAWDGTLVMSLPAR